jgi:hypothetical protein
LEYWSVGILDGIASVLYSIIPSFQFLDAMVAKINRLEEVFSAALKEREVTANPSHSRHDSF